jgi:nucleotide-binding universal stress UspA family protein
MDVYDDAIGVPFVYAEVIEEEMKHKEAAKARNVRCAEALLRVCQKLGIKSQAVILEGTPRTKICEYIEKHKPDFLVLASRGLGAIKRTLLGSVSDYCAHNANCPVIIYKGQ